MRSFNIQVSDETAAAIEFAAGKECVSTGEWLARFITDALVSEDRFCTRAEFEEAAHYILEKNHELYKRLAKGP
jgi:hypothetical protein